MVPRLARRIAGEVEGILTIQSFVQAPPVLEGHRLESRWIRVSLFWHGTVSVKRASLSAGQSFAKGNQDSQEKAKPGADLVELLAYSGCRIAEANALTWANVDFAKNTLAVTGGAGGTKIYDCRTVPLTDALRSLLVRLLQERSPVPSDSISQIDSAKKSLATACRRLG